MGTPIGDDEDSQLGDFLRRQRHETRRFREFKRLAAFDTASFGKPNRQRSESVENAFWDQYEYRSHT